MEVRIALLGDRSICEEVLGRLNTTSCHGIEYDITPFLINRKASGSLKTRHFEVPITFCWMDEPDVPTLSNFSGVVLCTQSADFEPDHLRLLQQLPKLSGVAHTPDAVGVLPAVRLAVPLGCSVSTNLSSEQSDKFIDANFEVIGGVRPSPFASEEEGCKRLAVAIACAPQLAAVNAKNTASLTTDTTSAVIKSAEQGAAPAAPSFTFGFSLGGGDVPGRFDVPEGSGGEAKDGGEVGEGGSGSDSDLGSCAAAEAAGYSRLSEGGGGGGAVGGTEGAFDFICGVACDGDGVDVCGEEGVVGCDEAADVGDFKVGGHGVRVGGGSGADSLALCSDVDVSTRPRGGVVVGPQTVAASAAEPCGGCVDDAGDAGCMVCGTCGEVGGCECGEGEAPEAVRCVAVVDAVAWLGASKAGCMRWSSDPSPAGTSSPDCEDRGGGEAAFVAAVHDIFECATATAVSHPPSTSGALPFVYARSVALPSSSTEAVGEETRLSSAAPLSDPLSVGTVRLANRYYDTSVPVVIAPPTTEGAKCVASAHGVLVVVPPSAVGQDEDTRSDDLRRVLDGVVTALATRLPSGSGCLVGDVLGLCVAGVCEGGYSGIPDAVYVNSECGEDGWAFEVLHCAMDVHGDWDAEKDTSSSPWARLIAALGATVWPTVCWGEGEGAGVEGVDDDAVGGKGVCGSDEEDSGEGEEPDVDVADLLQHALFLRREGGNIPHAERRQRAQDVTLALARAFGAM